MQENSVGDDWNVCLGNDISIRNIPRLTSVKLAADSTKKVKVKNTPKKVRQPDNPRHRNQFFPRFIPS